VADSDVYCQYCGERIVLAAATSGTPAKATDSQVPSTSGSARPASVQKKRAPRKKKQTQAEKQVQTTSCPACGYPVPPTAFFCPHCNAPVVEGSRPPSQNLPPSQQKTVKEAPSDLLGRVNFWLSTRNDKMVRNLIFVLAAMILLLIIALVFVYL
jgi:DNA-directed RNA polymerase subunit RPC12/RpoP